MLSRRWGALKLQKSGGRFTTSSRSQSRLTTNLPHFAESLSTTEDQDFGDLRLAEGSGRPLGTADFVTGLERLLGRPIARRAPGRKPAASVDGVQLRLLQ